MALKAVLLEKTVTTAGTRVQLSATSILVSSIFCETPRANTGYIYIGASDVSSTQFFHEFAIGKDTWSMTSPLVGGGGVRAGSSCIDLADLWIDSSVNGEMLRITYLPALGA